LELVTTKHSELFYLGHISLNYGFYYRRTFLKYPEKDVVVVRTEHLFDDLQNIEYLLGGTALVQGSVTGHESRDWGSTKYVSSGKITDPKDLQVLCCAIESEARIYIELLERASNLSEDEKKESLEAFEDRCNVNQCP